MRCKGVRHILWVEVMASTYSEPFKIFSASHTDTSPVSIPAAKTPRALACEGEFHASRLNLQERQRRQQSLTFEHSPRVGTDRALWSGLTFTSQLESFLMIRVKELGRPYFEMSDVAKCFVECTGDRSRRDERQG